MSAQAARTHMTIGDVLGRLRQEFPDVTVSKIRFLESEGLIEPDRTPSGYRKFSVADLERLRLILSTQRDHYLPLRVIKERLDAADRPASGPVGGGPEGRRPRKLVAAGTEVPDPDVRLTRRQLLDGAGIDESVLSSLEDFGLIRRVGGHYEGEALTIARTAAALGAFGFEARHLRAVKAAADREVGLIEQVVAPLLRQRNPGAHARADETARKIAALSLRLHSALVSAGLQEHLNR